MRATALLAAAAALFCFALVSPPAPSAPTGNAGKEARCTVHKIPLKAGKARILYGLPGQELWEYFKVQAKLFPNAHRFVLGGCIPSDQKEAQISYCTACRAAEEKWNKERAKK